MVRAKKVSQNYKSGEVENGLEEVLLTPTDTLAGELDVCYEAAEMVQAALREYLRGKKGQGRIRKAQKVHDARVEGEDA